MKPPSSSPASASPDSSFHASHVPGTWKATSPSRYFDDPIPPRRVPTGPRRTPQLQALTSDSHDWLSRLPPRYQPLTTARCHPHIINMLAGLWANRISVPPYLQELMLSGRPGREGFSFEVLIELADLQSLMETLLTRKQP